MTIKSHTFVLHQMSSCRFNCPAEITKLCLLHFHFISPNAAKYTTKLDKKIP